MRWRAHATSIGLTVAAGAALAYAYADRGSVTESEKKARDGSVFVAWRREELSRITLDHDGEHIVLDRAKDDAGDAEWWMRAPRVERADAEACDKLMSAFEFASVLRKVAADAKPPGFDPPRATGQLAMGAVTYRFALGGDAPSPADAVYFRVEGAGTRVVPRDLATAILQKADTYRSRQFVPYVSVQLARLDVRGPDGDVQIERADDVSFKLVPSGVRASRVKLDAVWGALGEMRAEAFVSDAVAAPLVAAPRETITMNPSAKDQPAGVVRVGQECPGNPEDVVVVRDAPTKLTACAPKGILAGLATPASALVDRRLFAAHDDEVAELRLETLPSGPALDLARKDDGWHERAPTEKDLDAESSEAAAALARAVVTAEGGEPRMGSEPFDAKTRVTVQRAGGVSEVVEVGAPDARGDVTVRRAFDGARLVVLAETARKLAPRGVALRGRDVWAPPIEGAPVASIETRCDGVEQRVTRADDAWSMASPKGYAPDNSSIVDLVDAVTRLRAEAWVADTDDGTFGFGGTPCEIALGLSGEGGAREVRLELGRDGEGGTYARASGSTAVFVAPVGLRDRARTWLVNLHGLSLPGLDAVQLEREGKRLAFAADASAGDDADAVVAAANVLRADRVAHLGAARAEEGMAHPSLVVTLRAGGASQRVVVGGEPKGDEKVRYARVPGVDATFEIDRDRLKSFYDPF
jgi:hypothetical protein